MNRFTTCTWKIHDEEANAWESECGMVWFFDEGTPKDNEMNFCPKCGHPLSTAFDTTELDNRNSQDWEQSVKGRWDEFIQEDNI